VPEPPLTTTNLEQWKDSLAREMKELPKSLELKVTLQNLINVNLDHALSLSIILAHEEIYPWFYESYIQLYSVRLLRRRVAGFIEIVSERERRGDEAENVVVLFLATPGADWLDECHVKMFFGSEPDDIISFILRSINLGCYLRVEVDEYYLPNKRSYGRRQFIHPAMVYGYDNEHRTLKILGFDANGYFTKLTFDYDDFRRAYESARLANPDSSVSRGLVLLVRMKTLKPLRSRYPFSVKRFLREMENYLSSRVDSAKKFSLTTFLPADADADAAFRFGRGVYEHFELGLENLALGNTGMMDYNSMHTLFEHKRFLRAAFGFVISEYNIEGRLVELTRDFEGVVQEFHSMRWKFIRYNVTKDSRLIRQIIEQFGAAREKEHKLLLRLHDQIHADCQPQIEKH
jgi:hypothetical protein